VSSAAWTVSPDLVVVAAIRLTMTSWETSGRGRVARLAHLLPPAPDRRDGEACGVVVGADRDPGAVGGQVVDAVGVCAAQPYRMLEVEVAANAVYTWRRNRSSRGAWSKNALQIPLSTPQACTAKPKRCATAPTTSSCARSWMTTSSMGTSAAPRPPDSASQVCSTTPTRSHENQW
jgi:hypothetical protein